MVTRACPGSNVAMALEGLHFTAEDVHDSLL